MTTTKTVFMFSGQGSQHYQMGRALFDHDPVFRATLVRLDDVAREIGGSSVVEALYAGGNDRAGAFDQTLLTHPAIFMVQYALAQSLIAAGVVPDLTLGTSLGSFAAAAVAGFSDPERMLAAVIQQAAALDTCCDRGTMIAVLADPVLFEQEFLRARCELAAVNFATHFVVSTPREQIAEVEAGLKARQVAFKRLPVGYAFHSRWIDPAQAPFQSFMTSIRCDSGWLPLVCCDHARVLDRLPDDFFWHVVRRPIRFREAITVLEQEHACEFVDVGPAGTLATFLRYILPPARRSAVHAILSPYGHDHTRLAAFAATRNRRH